ncbi:cytochrome c biogenesis CcdA family protein [Calidithermus timidus]|jgi:cytochrome c-type biogenesis protein|uniref:cytochrome c biogenesis CcdA family protein n=1 Tax=Calidithermus timidus TaxID=307124 RepID=UPI0003798EBA|nr:cytochrome c biogenesis CcdA family protein [Calidithermus timidus]
MALSLPIAFLAGVISFLSPCVLPLVPTYVLYLGGDKERPLVNAAAFILGFSAVFLLLGLPFTLLGSLLFDYREALSRIGGAVMILLGLYMLGLRPRWGVSLRYTGDTTRPWGAFILGIVLGLGWTPCIGPVLGGILTLTATGGGIHLLLAYILGLALPFFLVAAFTDHLRPMLRRMARFSHGVELAAGVVLLGVGILLLTGAYTTLNSFFLKITPAWLQDRL